MSPRITLNPAWPQYVGILSLFIAVFVGLSRYLLLDVADPYHCNALISKGTWMDLAKRSWQPDGCMMHSYSVKDSAGCLRSRDVVFIGDSVTRKLFFQFAYTLDPTFPTAPAADGEKHQDHQLLTSNGTSVSFYWDPFLNGTYLQSVISGSSSTTTDSSTRASPALLVIGSGLWYLRHASTSGGIPAWEANVDHIFKGFAQSRRPIADSLVMLPVEQLATSKLSPERAMTMHPSDIDAMNSDLFHHINPISFDSSYAQRTPIHLPLVFNRMLDPSNTEDGVHYSDSLVRLQASILLNLRCNDALPKQFPYNKSCCNKYPTPNAAHAIILGLLVLSIPFMCYMVSAGDVQRSISNPVDPKIAPYLTISAGLILVYFSDRSWFWLKEQKHFNSWTFSFLCLVALGCGCLGIRRADNDLGFLNRDQTDEWKGWMQIAILIYHYLGASKVSGIYNPIRVLVASYLFMTGYGHTTFYLRKADYGFLRVAQVLIRINMLTILLAYVMNTDYISYYFSPLVSMWFLIIYVTMGIGAKLNHRTPFLVGKIWVSAGLMTWLMREKWPLEMLFAFLEQVFRIHWSSREWMFRVELDLWIVYVGMFASITVSKIREYRLTDDHRWPLVQRIALCGSVLATIWFFAFELLQESKFAYNRWHPVVSFIPVLSFTFLRNANVILRSASSGVFAFIGKCSLETFILQYHFWLAGDTKGVLLVIPGTHLRPVNFVVTSIMFIYLSDRMAWATGEITSRFCVAPKPTGPALPLPTTTTTATDRNVETEVQEGGQELVPPARLQDPRASKGQDGNPVPLEPDTPIRPRRWIDRLAEVKPATKTYDTVAQRVFSFFSNTLRGHVTLALLIMWLFNILWTYP